MGKPYVNNVDYQEHNEQGNAKQVLIRGMDGSGNIVTVKTTTAGELVISTPLTISEPISVDDNGSSLTVDGTVTVNQGTANTAANAWFAKITDGTDTAAVVPGSDWGTTLNPATADGLKVAAMNHQLWPASPNRAGVSGDGLYYGQLMNDLGDLVVSLGSITNGSGSTLITSGAGTVSAGTPRVTLGSTDPAVVALQIIDDWDETDRCKVNPISGQAGVAAGSGTTGATTQRVVLATDTTVPNVTGNVAHDAADSGNPVKVGGVARTAHPTAVAGGDRADIYQDDLGRIVTVDQAPRDLITDATVTLTSTTETTVLAAVASTFLDVTAITIMNSSASAVRVDIRSATAGSVRIPFYVPAGATIGIVPKVPITQTASNNNWTAQLSSAVTDVRVYMQASKEV